jgi:hypothetical protein
MAIDASVQIIVPDLPDASIWFANAAAWKNYWKNITAEITFDGANTTIYVPFPYDVTLNPAYMVIDGVNYALVTVDMFNSMMNRLNALESSYQDLRTQLKDASIITNAQ